MLLPAGILQLQLHVEPMSTRPEVRAIGTALREEWGSRAGIVELLSARTGWVSEFQAFAAILQYVVPGDLPDREARALAGRTRAVYLPSVGALANGALLAGATRAPLRESMEQPALAAQAVLHLTHELAGHGALAENTAMGRSHERAARRKDAVSLACRCLPLAESLAAADDAFGRESERWATFAEGWSRWITHRLRPRLAARLPHLGEQLLSARPSLSQAAQDEQSRALIRRLAACGSSDPEALAAAWRQAVGPSPDARLIRASGLALFDELEALGGPEACLQAVHDCCSDADGIAPHLLILQRVQERLSRVH